MKYLTEEEMLELVGEKVADYTKEIYVFVPLSGDQPVVMYTSLFRGIPSKHYLGLELKLKYSGGLYVYNPESKPFDITQHEWSDDVMSVAKGSDKKSPLIKFREKYNNTAWVDIDDVIGFVKGLGLTAEDFK